MQMKANHSRQWDPYRAEAKEKWGNTAAYKEYEEKTKNFAKQKWDDLAAGMDGIMAAFAVCMQKGEMPDSAPAQDLVKMLQNYITEQYYLCTNEILAGLGRMYVADARFKNNIDQHADGAAVFICAAIEAYCHN